MKHIELHDLPELKPLPTIYSIKAGDELYCVFNGFVKITDVHRDTRGVFCLIAVTAECRRGEVVYTVELKPDRLHLHQSLFYTPSQAINYFMRQPYFQVSAMDALASMKYFDSVILSDDSGSVDIVTNGSSRDPDTLFNMIRESNYIRSYREIAMKIRHNKLDLENGRRQ